jgi:MFS family permease
LAVVGAGVFLITVAAHVRSPLLPEMGRELSMGPAALGALVAAFALGRIVTDLPAGRLTDRRSAPSMLAAAAGVVAVGSLLAGLAPVSTLAYVAALLLGAGSAWTNTTGIAAFSEAPRERRGVALSGFAAALLVGQAVGPALAGAVAAVSNWRAAFGAAAALAVGVAVWLSWSHRSNTTLDARPDPPTATTTIRPAVRMAVYLLPAVQFAIGGAFLQTLVPIVGDGELGLSVGTLGTAIGLAGLLRLGGAVVSGRVSDAYSRRWALFPGLVMQILGLAVFAAWGSAAGWWTAIVLTSIGSTAVNVGATLLADLSEGGRLGHRLGVFRITGDVALFVAPLVAGVLYEGAGRGVAVGSLAVFVAGVTAFAAGVLPETRRHPHVARSQGR